MISFWPVEKRVRSAISNSVFDNLNLDSTKATPKCFIRIALITAAAQHPSERAIRVSKPL